MRRGRFRDTGYRMSNHEYHLSHTDADAAPWMGRLLAHVVLRLGRFSPFRLASGPLNRRLRREGGVPFKAPASDGVPLDAIFLPARREIPQRLPVIMAHGYTEIKEFHARHAALLQRHGHDVVLFDLRAHGRSGGRITTLGAFEKHDFSAVIDEAQRRGLIEGRVITRGYSTSAAAAIQHAPLDERVAGLIAIAPFVDLAGAIRSFRRMLGGWYDEEKLLAGFAAVARRAGFSFADSRTDEAIRQLKVPLLLVAGDADRNLPPALHAEVLARQFPHERCEFLRIAGAGHVSIYRRTWPLLDEATLRFCASVET